MTTTTVTTPDQTTLFVRDLGSGPAAVLLHGWTVGHELWDRQFETLPAAGVRCVAYDRRGCGRSSAPDQGYDYDTLADDLHAVLAQLELGDVTLVAHSMAVGEALRYLARHGADRISSLVLVAPTTPDLLPPPLLDAMVSAMQSDLPGYLAAGAPGFFGRDASPELLDWGVGLAARAPLPVAVELTRTFATTDLRSELAVVTVPTVVVHGDADDSSPIENGRATAVTIPGARFVAVAGAPHGLPLTHGSVLDAQVQAALDPQPADR